jgi:hypothetical protein
MINTNVWDLLRQERRRVTAGMVAILFANLTACTEYVPVRGAVAAGPASQVRVTLTDEGTIDVAPRLGLRAERLEGVLQSMSDSSLTLMVRKVSRQGGIEDTYAGEQILLPRRDFDAVETGKTAVSRSILLTGAIIAGALLVARGAGDFSGGKSGGTPPPTR